jgi:hypothetical protein
MMIIVYLTIKNRIRMKDKHKKIDLRGFYANKGVF